MDPALIIAGIDAGIKLITLALKGAEGMKQNRELDAVNEAALDAKIASLQQQPWWKPATRPQTRPDFRGDAVM